jgi:hypothetical protein
MRIYVYDTNIELVNRLANVYKTTPTKLINFLINDLDRISQDKEATAYDLFKDLINRETR